MAEIVGIDFGTTNSLVSFALGERVQPLTDKANGDRPHPSVVWYHGNEVIVGRRAKAQLGEDESGLTAGGHFFVECKHNCGHVEPPLVPPEGESKYAGMWEFVLDHPYWLPAGQSPYLTDGLPPTLPSWCGIGASSATPRSGGGGRGRAP